MTDTPRFLPATDGPGLAPALIALSGEVAALRRELRDVRQAVHRLRTDLAEQRRRASDRHEQHVVLRTQMRVLWAVAGVAGTSALGALVVNLLTLLKGASP